MTYSTPRRVAILLLGAATLALTGCTAPSTGYADLDQAPSAQDTLPAGMHASDLTDPDTIRFVTDDGDWSVWIASGIDTGNICLIVYGSVAGGYTSCSGVVGGVETNVGGPGGAYGVLPDGATLPDNATAISANVYRIGRS